MNLKFMNKKNMVGLIKMPISYNEWISINPELENPLMVDNTEFIKKLSQDDWEQMLQFLFSIIQKDRDNLKLKLITILNNSYIQQTNKNISKIDIVDIRNYIENTL